jgi:hypothetical protein
MCRCRQAGRDPRPAFDWGRARAGKGFRGKLYYRQLDLLNHEGLSGPRRNHDYLEVFEPIRRQLSVANRMLDVRMTEVCLQSAGVVAPVRIAIGEALLLGMRRPAAPEAVVRLMARQACLPVVVS